MLKCVAASREEQPVSPVRLVATMCVAQVIGMLGMFTFAALLPTFIAAWQLTNTGAGWVSVQ